MFFHASRNRPVARSTRGATRLLVAQGLVLLALQGCERGADSGATSNPVAPGQPGTSAPTKEVAPVAGSSNQSPQVGGSTVQIPVGVTGSGGTTDLPGESQGNSTTLAQPGSGLQGGLGGSNAGAAGSPAAGASASGSTGAAGPASASPNTTPGK
jgi:hypothetical protein